jgi:hypothetical protein
MKRIFSIILAGLLILPAMAQNNLQSVEEEDAGRRAATSPLFPASGSIGIGFDATPFLNYAGNMFNSTTNNSLNLSDNMLHFRYFLQSSAAIRAALLINTDKDVNKQYVTDDAARIEDPLSLKKIEDHQITINKQYNLKIGYQMFRGNNRLRGFYGADIFLEYSKVNEEYEYGNQMTEINPAPSSFWAPASAQRTLEIDYGKRFSAGLGAFCGAEYYLMPKVAIGTELGAVYAQTFAGQSSSTYEEMVGSEHVISNLADNPGERNHSMVTSFPYGYGSLYLMIHF